MDMDQAGIIFYVDYIKLYTVCLLPHSTFIL